MFVYFLFWFVVFVFPERLWRNILKLRLKQHSEKIVVMPFMHYSFFPDCVKKINDLIVLKTMNLCCFYANINVLPNIFSTSHLPRCLFKWESFWFVVIIWNQYFHECLTLKWIQCKICLVNKHIWGVFVYCFLFPLKGVGNRPTSAIFSAVCLLVYNPTVFKWTDS